MKKALEGASQKLRRSSRMKNPVVRYGYNEYMAHHYAYMMKISEDREPETYAEAAEDPRWIEAMREEMRALVENDTWDLVPASETMPKPIGCRWVYKVKHNVSGTVNHTKHGLLPRDTRKPTISITKRPFHQWQNDDNTYSTRLATAKAWHLHQMNAKNAFLQGELQEEVYVGFQSNRLPNEICQLKMPL